MNIEVTDACNLRCHGCFRSTESATFMSVPAFRFIGRRLRTYGLEQVALYWRGEPCLHPKLPEIAEVSKELGFKKVWISTNTAVPTLHDTDYVSKLLSHLDRIVASVDGYDQASLGGYRVGANWNVTLKNIEAIGETETDCTKEMKVLMFKYNDGHEDFYRKLAKKNNFDSILFTSPIIKGTIASTTDIETWMSTNPKFQRYRAIGNNIWEIKRRKKCTARCVIAVNGSLHPCCSDWDLRYPLGSVIMHPLDRLMTRKTHNQLRTEMSAMKLPMCKNWCCTPSEPVVFRENV